MQVEVELHRAGQEVEVVLTEDLSEGGVFVRMDGLEFPPVGSRVHLRLVGTLGEGETPPMVEAVIVRHLPNGVALAFDT